MLLIEHVVCDHGELVDEAGHLPSRDAAARSADEAREAGAALGVDRTDQGDHDHCDAASILHRADVDVSPLVDSALLSHLEPTFLSEGTEVRLASPLELAPKGSPPHA